MISRPIFCRRLIGRGRELDFLVEQRRNLAQAHGGIVLIAGEAGIGKSRLVRAFLNTMANSRGRVGVAQCRAFGANPYGPILQLLETFCPATTRMPPAESQAAELQTLVDGFLVAAERHALVGVIEDFHWADRGSAAVLAVLADSLATRRILLVVTYRSQELHAEHALYGPLATLLRNHAVRQIDLGPLSSQETSEFISATLEESAASVPPQTRRDIARVGEGNPFFTEELLKAAVERERWMGSDCALPRTVHAAILERLETLEARDRAILTQAAVIGRQFGGDVLAQTLDVPFEQLLPALQRARRSQLVEETGEPRTFRFRHALTREVIYDDLLAAQRQPLHRRIAAVLQETDAERSVDALAYHWWATGDRERALLYGERAGDVALTLHEYAGAIAAYERVFGLLAAGERDAARVAEKMGASYFLAGLMDRAIDYYLPAWNFFRNTTDDPTYLFHLARSTAAAMANDGRTRDALAFWRDAIAIIVSCGDRRVADLARITYAWHLVDAGDDEETLAVLESVDESRIDADGEVAVPYWSTISWASALRGDVARVRFSAERLCGLPGEQGYARQLVTGLVYAGDSALIVGETAAARDCYTRANGECAAQKPGRALIADTLLAGALERALSGAYLEARSRFYAALPLLGETRLTWYTALIVALCVGDALNDRELLSYEPSVGVMDEIFAVGKAWVYGPLAGVCARLLAGRGDRDAARRLVQRAVRAATAAKPSLGTFPLVIEAAQLCAGSQADAVRTLSALDATKGPAPAAAGALAEAILQRRFGGRAEAIAAARHAARGFATAGWPLYEALAFEEAGDEPTARRLREHIGYVDKKRRPRSSGTALGGLLTPRDLEVARLVARGRTNREVAVALSVSVKLVEKQLSSIYHKLGVQSRSQLTATLLSFEPPDAPRSNWSP